MSNCFFCGKDLRRGGDFVRNTDGVMLCKNCVSTATDIFLRKDTSQKGPVQPGVQPVGAGAVGLHAGGV